MKDYSYLTKDYCGTLKSDDNGFIFYNIKAKLDVRIADNDTYILQVSDVEKDYAPIAVSFRTEEITTIFIKDILKHYFKKKGSQISLFEGENNERN